MARRTHARPRTRKAPGGFRLVMAVAVTLIVAATTAGCGGATAKSADPDSPPSSATKAADAPSYDTTYAVTGRPVIAADARRVFGPEAVTVTAQVVALAKGIWFDDELLQV